jgi:hypothetical protein
MFKRIIILTTMLVFISVPAMAGLTLTNKKRTTFGHFHAMLADVAFDSSYADGGEDLDFTAHGFNAVYQVNMFAKGGYTFDYRSASGVSKVRVYANAPAIVYEEQHTPLYDGSTATAFQLDYPAAYIVSVVREGGTPYPITYSGETNMGLGYATLSAPIQDGVRTGVSIHMNVLTSNTDFYVTYATQAWTDLYALLVQNERMTMGDATSCITRYTVSGNSIFAFGWAKIGGGMSAVTPIEYSDTAAAGEMGVDLLDYHALNSGATQSVCKVATGAQDYYITYLKQPARDESWLRQRYIRDENADATSGTSVQSFDRALLLWMIGGYVFSTGDNSFQIALQDQPQFWSGIDFKGANDPGSGVSETIPAWNYRGGHFDLDHGGDPRSGNAVASVALTEQQVWGVVAQSGIAFTHGTYLFGHPWEIPNLQPLEVHRGTDLSNLTDVKLMIIGR